MATHRDRAAANDKPAAGTSHKTACILCSLNCGIEVDLVDGHLTRIRGDKAHPMSHGYTCQKALRLDYYQNGRSRVTSPLRRRPTARSRKSPGRRPSPRSRPRSKRSATITAATRSPTTVGVGRGITSAERTARRCAWRWARATSTPRLRKRRPAASGSTANCLAIRPAIPPKTSSTPTFSW